jgi:hypothetical protein
MPPIALHKPATVRSAALRRSALSLAKAFSIGLKPGLQGGRKRSRAPAASISARTLGPLWLERVSMATTSPGLSPGTRTRST